MGLAQTHDSVCLTSFWVGLMLLVFGQNLGDMVPRQLCSLEPSVTMGTVYMKGC